jgi:hypothetical protein
MAKLKKTKLSQTQQTQQTQQIQQISKEAIVEAETEAHLQTLCERYLEILNLRYIHIPSQLQRFIWGSGIKTTASGKPWRVVPIHIAKQASQAFKGQPDLLVFGTDGRFLAVELKVGHNTLTPEQKTWLPYGLHVVRSFDGFKAIVSEWLKGGAA